MRRLKNSPVAPLIHALADYKRAVAGAECNTVIELKLEHHAA
ncbi:MAG: hypothetical protein ACFWUJ_16000 [Pseudomonas fragi]|jgi:hypothetical protein